MLYAILYYGVCRFYFTIIQAERDEKAPFSPSSLVALCFQSCRSTLRHVFISSGSYNCGWWTPPLRWLGPVFLVGMFTWVVFFSQDMYWTFLIDWCRELQQPADLFLFIFWPVSSDAVVALVVIDPPVGLFPHFSSNGFSAWAGPLCGSLRRTKMMSSVPENQVMTLSGLQDGQFLPGTLKYGHPHSGAFVF